MNRLKIAAAVIGLLLMLGLIWFSVSQDPRIWPLRNTIKYHGWQSWWQMVGRPATDGSGQLTGRVQNQHGQPVAGAWVLLSQWDGTTYKALSNAQGEYQITGVPAGRYRPIASAPGYANHLGAEVAIANQHGAQFDITLRPAASPQISPAENLTLGESQTRQCESPLPRQATRQTVHFSNAGEPNQLTLYYHPVTATTRLPMLLTIYPGPAESWECASIPLAAAGYSVLSVGPAYEFTIENQLDELSRLLTLAQVDGFPHGDGSRVGLLGGSFSSIHVQRLLQRRANAGEREQVQAAVLLGPPSDMFALRQRFEAGSFKPPFGLDQVMIAAGLPSDNLLRYWRYSAAYHVREALPPLALLHSRSDEVVPFQQTEWLAENLARVGAPHEVHIFDQAGHYLLAADGDDDAMQVYRLTLDFLRRHLREGE